MYSLTPRSPSPALTDGHYDYLVCNDKVDPRRLAELEDKRAHEDLQANPRQEISTPVPIHLQGWASDQVARSASDIQFDERSEASPSARGGRGFRTDRIPTRTQTVAGGGVSMREPYRPQPARMGAAPMVPLPPTAPPVRRVGPRVPLGQVVAPRSQGPLLGDRLIANPREYQMTSQEKRRMSREYYYRLMDLQKDGTKLSKQFTLDSDPEEMKAEYQFHRHRRSRANMHGYVMGGLVYGTLGLELVNKKYNPFAFKLDGWSKNVQENQGRYDEVIEEIVDRWHGGEGGVGGLWTGLPPEFRLFLMLVASGITYHVAATMLGPGGTEQTVKDNRDLSEYALKDLRGQSSGPAPSIDDVLDSISKGGYTAPAPAPSEPRLPSLWDPPQTDDQVAQLQQSLADAFRQMDQMRAELAALRAPATAAPAPTPTLAPTLRPDPSDPYGRPARRPAEEIWQTVQGSPAVSPTPVRAVSPVVHELDALDLDAIVDSVENTEFPQRFEDTPVASLSSVRSRAPRRDHHSSSDDSPVVPSAAATVALPARSRTRPQTRPSASASRRRVALRL